MTLIAFYSAFRSDDRSLPIISHALYTTCSPRRPVGYGRRVGAPARSCRPHGRSARGAHGLPRRRHLALLELGVHHADPDSGRGGGPRVRRVERLRAYRPRRHASENQRRASTVRKADQREPGRDWLPLRHQRRRERRGPLDAPRPRRQRRHRRTALRNRVRAVCPPREDHRRRAARRQGERTAQ